MVEFFKSFKVFLFTSIKTLYGWVAFTFGLSSLILPFINIPLPPKYRGCDMSIILMTIAWCFAFIAAFKVYHDLRIKSVSDYNDLKEKRIKEVYASFPETKKGMAFRELFKLYEWGESEKKTCEERQRRWDDEVIIMLNKHFSGQCKVNYLLETRRRPELLPNVSPLDVNEFDSALYYIENLLKRDFDTYFES